MGTKPPSSSQRPKPPKNPQTKQNLPSLPRPLGVRNQPLGCVHQPGPHSDSAQLTWSTDQKCRERGSRNWSSSSPPRVPPRLLHSLHCPLLEKGSPPLPLACCRVVRWPASFPPPLLSSRLVCPPFLAWCSTESLLPKTCTQLPPLFQKDLKTALGQSPRDRFCCWSE